MSKRFTKKEIFDIAKAIYGGDEMDSTIPCSLC